MAKHIARGIRWMNTKRKVDGCTTDVELLQMLLQNLKDGNCEEKTWRNCKDTVEEMEQKKEDGKLCKKAQKLLKKVQEYVAQHPEKMTNDMYDSRVDDEQPDLKF